MPTKKIDGRQSFQGSSTEAFAVPQGLDDQWWMNVDRQRRLGHCRSLIQQILNLPETLRTFSLGAPGIESRMSLKLGGGEPPGGM